MTTKVDNIIKAYANDMDGLTREECLHENFSAQQCKVLENALDKDWCGTKGTGQNGIVTPEEKMELEQAGFAKNFIQGLAGTDGKKALRIRARWLGEHINTGEWYRRHNGISTLSNAVMELQAIGADAKEAVPALIMALKDKNENVRYHAATALANVGPDAKAAVPALIDLLNDVNWKISPSAIVALGNIGPDAKAAIPALIDDLKGERMKHPILEAAMALGKIGKEAVPGLIDALNDQDRNARANAITALGYISQQAFFAIPVLQKMAASDPDRDCRILAKQLLEKMMGEIR